MDIKTCPYCGKKILAIAKVCKHCRQSLREVPANGAPTTAPKLRPVPKPVVADKPISQPQPSKPIQTNATSNAQSKPEQKQKINPFSPKGRINRWGYAKVLLTYLLWCWWNIGGYLGNILGPLFGLFLFYLLIIAAIKRNHDFNFCGWWILIPFWALVIAFIPGSKGENDYGVEPK